MVTKMRPFVFGAIVALTPLHTNAEMIHLFARKGDAEKIQAEIAKGVDVDLPSTRNTTEIGVSPLFIAAKFGRVAAVEALLEAGADPSAFFEDSSAPYPYGSPLYVAAAWGHLDIVKLLLAANADPNQFHRLIGAPLQAAKEAGHPQIARALVEAGAIEQVHAEPIDHLIRIADPAKGDALAGTCRTCHSMTTETIEGGYPAPPLWDVVGRDLAVLDFAYSDSLTEAPGTWTYNALNSYIASPYAYLPGTKMYFGGVEKAEERAAIIAFLRTLSNNPVALP